MEQEGVRSFLSDVFKKEGKELDDNTFETVVKSYNNDYDSLVTDVAKRFKVKDVDGFKSEVFKNYGLAPKENEQAVNYGPFNPEEVNKFPQTKQNYERWQADSAAKNNIPTDPNAYRAMSVEQAKDFATKNVPEKQEQKLSPEDIDNAKMMLPEVEKLIGGVKIPESKPLDVYEKNYGIYGGGIDLSNKDQNVASSTLSTLNKAKDYYKAVANGDANAVSKFWSGLKAIDIENTLSLGIKGMANSIDIYKAAKNYSAGKATPEETNLLIAKALLDDIQSVAQKDRAVTVGSGLAEMAPWLAQFAVTGGLGTGVAKAVTGTALTEKLAANAAAKLLGKPVAKLTFGEGARLVGGKMAGAAAQTAAQVPMLGQGTAERMTDRYQVGEDGLTQVSEGEGFGEAILRTYANNFLENLSERGVGDAADFLATKGINSFVKSKAFGQTYVADIINWTRKNPYIKLTNRTLGLNTPLSENIEEAFTGITQPFVTEDNWQDIKKGVSDYFTGENLYRTFLTTAAMGASMGAVQFPFQVYNTTKSEQGRKIVEGAVDDRAHGLFMAAATARTIDERQKNFDEFVKITGLTKDQVKPVMYYYQTVLSQIENGIDPISGSQITDDPELRENAKRTIETSIQVRHKVNEFGDSEGKVTTTQIDGATYYIRNSKDLGTEGAVIFIKDSYGNTKPIPSGKITEWNTQTPEEVFTDLMAEEELRVQQAKDYELLQLEAKSWGIKPGAEINTPFGTGTVVSLNEDGTITAVDEEGQQAIVTLDEVQAIETNFQEQLDAKIKAAQVKLNIPNSPDIPVSDDTELTLEKLEAGEPVPNSFLQNASDELYEIYNNLETMKYSDSRLYSIEQIESMQEYLGEEITKLENYAGQQSESGEFVNQAQTSQTAETGAGPNTVQNSTTGTSEEEVNIDELSPEEAFNELAKTDIGAAQAVLEDEVASIRAKAKEIRKQPAEKRSQKVEFVKQANLLESEATRLETILSESKKKLAESANISETKIEKIPKTGQKGAVSQKDTDSKTENSSQKEQPAPVVSEQKVETVAEEPHQESPTKGEPVEPAKDVKLRITSKAKPEMSHKKDALNAVAKLSEEYGVPTTVIHSSEVSEVVGKAAENKRVFPVAFYHNRAAYIIADKITSVADVKKSYLHEAVLHKGLDILFDKGPITLLGKSYNSKDEFLDEVYSRIDTPLIQELAKEYAKNFNFENGKFSLIPSAATSKLTTEQAQEIITGIQREVAEEVLARLAEMEKTPSRLEVLMDSLWKYIKKTVGFSSNQFTKTDLHRMLSEHRAMVKQATGVNAETKDTGTKFRTELPATINVDGKERPTLNSEGNPIHPTEEGIINFWKWFGDSKVVDEQGRPLVVYHGSYDKFEVFNNALSFFSQNEYVAESYGDGETLYEVYLKIENPLDLRGKTAIRNIAYTDPQLIQNMEDVVSNLPDDYIIETTFGTFDKKYISKNLVKETESGIKYIDHNMFPMMWDAISKYARKNGYDGWFHNDESFDKLVQHAPSFATFSNKQQKSVPDNQGTFDSNNPDIRFRTSDIGFYSPTERALEKIKQEKGTVHQFHQQLMNNGAKQAELDWMGWDEFARDKNVMTKSEIQEWIDGNKVAVEEVVKGNNNWDGDELIQDGETVATLIDNEDGTWSYQSDFSDGSETFDSKDEAKKEAEINTIGDSFSERGTKYSQYQLPGGQNYREVLLTMPVKDNTITVAEKEELENLQRRQNNEIDFPQKDLDRLRELMQKGRDSFDNKNQFKSSHFDEPNILAHIRFNERTDSEGNKVLFIEEIQSDWAQKGKKEGFREKKSIDSIRDYYIKRYLSADKSYNELSNEDKTWLDNLIKEKGEFIPIQESGKVPDMPFKQTPQWVNLALRRMIRYAAENGFDRIAWTTGEQQAERYDLSKQLSAIHIEERGKGRYYVDAWDKINYKFMDKRYAADKNELSELIGKDMTNKFIEERAKGYKSDNYISEDPDGNAKMSFEGLDLKVGGEGMKTFYDAIVPNAAKDLGKKFGAKVEPTQIEAGEEVEKTKDFNNVRDALAFEKLKNKEGRKYVTFTPFGNTYTITWYEGDKSTVQSLPITESMRESVLKEGVPMFRTRSGKPIGFDYDTDKVAREQFDFSNLKKLGGGSDRDVFDLGDDKVLKVAKTARGLTQNIHEGDYYLEGIIPKAFERGLNYVVVENIPRATSADKIETYDVDGNVIGESTIGKMISEFSEFNQRDFDKINPALQDAVYKYGFQDIFSYDVLWGDFAVKRNWGYKDGKACHIDGGTFGGVDMITSHKGKTSMEDSEFREIYYESRRLKKQFGDTDKNTRFRVQTNTPEFKAWFGKSKVKDANGKPLVLYHGTNAIFNIFDPEGRGNTWDAEFPDGAIFLTDDPKRAKLYGNIQMPLFAKIEDPIRKTIKNGSGEEFLDNDFSLYDTYYNERGDGIIVKGKDLNGNPANVYVVFSSNQIKSATDNNGEFDINNPDIRFRLDYVPESVSRELSFDNEGNVMFVHFGKKQYDILDPKDASHNPSNISSKEELAAKSTAGGVIDLYTHPEQQEPGTGTFAHIIKVDPDKVYHLQSDPLNLYSEAKTKFDEKFPGQAFTPNHQAAWVSKVANEHGFDVLITDWRRGPIGKITKPMIPTEGESGQRQLYEKNAGQIIGGFVEKKPDDIKFRVKQAEEQTNTNPSEAQKSAGNYKKGHVVFDGFDISIENPKGSVRSGETKVGKKWSVELPASYGYFRGTKGKDKDHIDVFIGNNPETDKIYVVDQLKNDGTFDEHKVMLGFNSVSEARNTYMKAFEPGWMGLGAITRTDKKGLKEWFANGDMNDMFSDSNIRFKVAYHGSPHSFDRFSLGKIGTGEGAQAFGWGLYFTDKESIAKGYAKMNDNAFSASVESAVNENKLTVYNDINDVEYSITKNEDGYYDVWLDPKESFAKERKIDYDIQYIEDAISEIKQHAKNNYSINENKLEWRNGRTNISQKNLYKVKLHGDRSIDEFNYLRWDKPLTNEQVDGIISVLIKENKIDNFDDKYWPTKNAKDNKAGGLSIDDARRKVLISVDAGRIYEGIANMLGSQKEASLFLLRAGIDGIKYPTEITTKGSHEDTFNYVIFDENTVEIEEHIRFRTKSPNPKIDNILSDLESLKKSGSVAKGNTPPKSVNEDVQAAMEKAHGLKKLTFIDKISEWALEMKQMSQHFKYITQKEFPVVYNKLRLFEAIPDVVKKEAFETVSNITKPILKDKELYSAFERYVVLKDLIPDLEAQAAKGKLEMRWGYKDIAEVRQDLANLQKYVDANPVLKKTLELRKAYMDEIRDALIQNNLLGEKAKEKESYFHRQVLMYMDEKNNNATASKSSVRNKEQSFQKARKEEAMAEYNTNYLESEFEVLAKSIEQLRIKKILNDIGKEVNIKDKLLADAKKNNVRWSTLIPEGYVVWQPKSGTTPFKAATPAEKIVQNEIQNLEGADELQKALNEVDKTQWVIPEAVAEQLNDMKPSVKEPAPVKAMRFFNSSWKQWILMNPYRVLKYNLNNMSGDLDIVMAYNPAILKKQYAHNALKELISEMKGNGMSQDMKEAMEQGVISSGLSIQEIPDINEEGIFRTLVGNDNLIEKYWTKTKDFTQLRENMLRLASYKYFKEQMQKGTKLYGASNHTAVDAIKDPIEKAGKLARELMGDYGNLSLGGQWLRSHLYPFWSWMEVNSPRYFRLLQNLAYEKRAGLLGTVPVVLAAKLTSRLLMLGAFVTLWNHLFFHDEDEELSKTGNRQLRLIVGRREDGTIMTIRIQGAFSDVLSFVGLEDAPKDIRDVAKGKATVSKKAEEAAKAFGNKMLQGAMPFEKNLAEIGTGMTFYPDMFNPRPSRDRIESALKMFSMDKLYAWATKKPLAGGKELANLIMYESNPGESAYFLINQKARDYMDELGEERPSAFYTDKQNALYYYKKAVKLKNTKLANHWLARYAALGGTPKGMNDSIEKGIPLASLGKHKEEFVKTLDAEDLEVLEIANDWYRKTYASPAIK